MARGEGGGSSTLRVLRALLPYTQHCRNKNGIPLRATAGLCIATNTDMVLYRNLRIHHVFGANTDVGKTVFSAVLTLASVAADRSTFYLKPVSTGPLTDADNRCVFF